MDDMLNDFEFAFPDAYAAPEWAKVSNAVRRTASRPATEHAMSTVYHTYVYVLYDYGMQMCHDQGIVSDCLKELFSKFRQGPERLSDDPSIKSYLFKSLRDLLIHRIVEHKQVRLLRADSAFEFVSIGESMVIEDETRASQAIRLKNSLRSLPVSQREIIYLRFQMDLTHFEIARVTGMHVDSVDKLVTRVIELLCRKMKVPDSPIPLL